MVIVLIVLWILSIIIISLVCYKKDRYEKIFNIKTRTCCTIFWPVLKVYHPLISVFFPLRTRTRSIPLIYHALSFFIYIFSIVMLTCLDLIFLANYDYNPVRAIKFAGIYLGAFIIVRPIFNQAKYSMYFY